MKWDWQHILILLGAPALMSGLEFALNQTSPFSKTSLEHAGLVMLLTLVALAKKSFLPSAAAMVLILLTGCGSSQPQMPTKIVARGVVGTLAAAWEDAANACVEAAQAPGATFTIPQCGQYLLPGHDAIVAAADGIDAWTAADQNNLPCFVGEVARGLSAVAGLPGVNVSTHVKEGLTLAQSLAGQCKVTP